MRAPKHLWSGDWERESAAVSDELASLEVLPRVTPEEPAPPARAEARRPREARMRQVRRIRLRAPSRRVRRAGALAVALMLVLAAAGYGLATVLSSTNVNDVPAAAGPSETMTWLGMEVETIHPGHVVVATVAPGSRGEQAGLEPGDVLVAIDSRALDSTADIAKAIFGVQAGDKVQIEVGRGSTVFITSATLGAPPAKYP